MLSIRKFDAVVFDLWGTLVDDPASDPGYVRMTKEVAALLGVDQPDGIRECVVRRMVRARCR